MKNKGSRLRIALLGTMLVAAVSGALLTVVLMDHHRGGQSTSAFVSQVCGSDTTTGCNVVNRSAGSVFLGLPVAFWGWLYYCAALLFLAAFFIWRKTPLLQFLFTLSLMAFLSDVVLFSYSLFALGTVCNLCLLSYIATLGLLLPSFYIIYQLRKQKESFMSYFPKNFKRLFTDIRRPAIFITVSMLLAVVGGLMYCSEPANSNNHDSSKQDYNALLNSAFQDFQKAYLENPKVDMGAPVGGIYGPSKAVLKIHEFADPLCPHCALMGAKLKALAEKFPNDIQVIYRHFPLDSNCNRDMKRQLHAGSCELAYAMQCAGQQGKFFEVHDDIFANQETWAKQANTTALSKLAQSKGLNVNSFKSCLASPRTKAAVAKDIETAIKLHITGTPTVYINNRQLPGVHLDFLDVFLGKLIEVEKEKK